jgi:hypothetical protein
LKMWLLPVGRRIFHSGKLQDRCGDTQMRDKN